MHLQLEQFRAFTLPLKQWILARGLVASTHDLESSKIEVQVEEISPASAYNISTKKVDVAEGSTEVVQRESVVLRWFSAGLTERPEYFSC